MFLHALMMQLRREQAVTKILHIRKARIPILKVRHSWNLRCNGPMGTQHAAVTTPALCDVS